MPPLGSCLRVLIIGVALSVTLLASGCSAVRLAYNQAPSLAYWWLDGYGDFNDAQTPRVRDSLAAWFTWHRATQLPDYAALLARAQPQLTDNATPAQICRWNDDITQRLETAFDQAIPALADWVASSTPQQLQHIEGKYAKNNATFTEDFLQIATADRLKASVDRAVSRAEMVYGTLDAAQRERIAQGVAESPFNPALWLAERKARQQDILQTLRRLQASRVSPEQAQPALRTLATGVLRSPRDDYRGYQERLKQYNCRLAAQLHNVTTPAQRKIAAQKLKGWEDDVRALMAESAR